MKKIILLSLSLLLLSSCSSKKKPVKEEITQKEPTKEEPKKEIINTIQTLSPSEMELKRYLKLYLSQLKSLDADSIISMTYPKLFRATSKYLYKGSIFTMANSSNVNIISFDTSISKIGKIQSFSNGNFTNIAYTSVILIQFLNPDLYNTEISLNALHSTLAKKYGQNNIYVDKEQRTIRITKHEKLLAIQERPYNWKFLGDNPAYRKLYPQFLPYDILNQI